MAVIPANIESHKVTSHGGLHLRRNNFPQKDGNTDNVGNIPEIEGIPQTSRG